jgi:hypothetical protein
MWDGWQVTKKPWVKGTASIAHMSVFLLEFDVSQHQLLYYTPQVYHTSILLLLLLLFPVQGHFDPQTLEMRGVLWMLNTVLWQLGVGLILASVEDPSNGVTMTACVISAERK